MERRRPTCTSWVECGPKGLLTLEPLVRAALPTVGSESALLGQGRRGHVPAGRCLGGRGCCQGCSCFLCFRLR